MITFCTCTQVWSNGLPSCPIPCPVHPHISYNTIPLTTCVIDTTRRLKCADFEFCYDMDLQNPDNISKEDLLKLYEKLRSYYGDK